LALGGSVSGYCYKLDVYQGRGEEPRRETLGGMVVKALVENLPIGSHIYFENFFTSLPLLYFLSGENYRASGTMHSIQVGNCLNNIKALEKCEKGVHEVALAPSVRLEINLWKDN